MTKEELKDYYKVIKVNKVNEDIISIKLNHEKDDPNRQIHILIAYNKLYYTGDMGTFVFGGSIFNVKEFFRGKEINPEYWSEKCEASGIPIIDSDIDEVKCREEFNKYLEFDKRTLTEDELSEVDDYFCDWDEYSAYSTLHDIFEYLGYEDCDSSTQCIVNKCQNYNNRYLYACEVIQWVENDILGE